MQGVGNPATLGFAHNGWGITQAGLAGNVDNMTAVRHILSNHTAGKVDGVLVDVQTANVIQTVYNALNPVNQAKFAAMPMQRMAEVAWKLISKNDQTGNISGGSNRNFDQNGPMTYEQLCLAWGTPEQAGRAAVRAGKSLEELKKLMEGMNPKYIMRAEFGYKDEEVSGRNVAKNAGTCEDADPECSICRGHCDRAATMRLHRIDIGGIVNFCQQCGEDALASGVFTGNARDLSASWTNGDVDRLARRLFEVAKRNGVSLETVDKAIGLEFDLMPSDFDAFSHAIVVRLGEMGIVWD